MKAIFGDVEARYNEETRYWDCDYEMLRDSLNSKLWYCRTITKRLDLNSVDFAVEMAKRHLPTLEFLEE